MEHLSESRERFIRENISATFPAIKMLVHRDRVYLVSLVYTIDGNYTPVTDYFSRGEDLQKIYDIFHDKCLDILENYEKNSINS